MESSNTDEIVPFVDGFSEHQCGMEKNCYWYQHIVFLPCSVKSKLNLANLYLNKT